MSSCLHSATARVVGKLVRNAAARAPRGAVLSRALLLQPTFIGYVRNQDGFLADNRAFNTALRVDGILPEDARIVVGLGGGLPGLTVRQ